ncbi:MAG: hypothetical protein CVV27_05915 [Candidatus Melainabacteria bacterium HGW-Melainabacteria-1]|nr:MAG: hypothetical protein CVV27_05915 [Candidatus Melainabacteria bacterium HGW-Melainabacteria-1]
MPLIQRLRTMGVLEGYSYLFLLLIAMPLKYFAHQPLAVQIGGWFHGLFFVLFTAFLILATRKYGWSLFQFGLAFASAFIPFGTFVLDRKLKQIEFPAD